MKWSISKSKMFFQCQRKWYFSSFAASHGSKDQYRKEIFLLDQLQSIHAWRGSLVDKVIEKKIVPIVLKEKRIPSKSEAFEFASTLIERQLEFGKARRYREPEMTKTKAGDSYAAFYEIEYESGLDEGTVQNAIQEIKTSIQNLLESNFLERILKNNSYLATQKTLSMKFDGESVTSTPDLIVFREKHAPIIVDWKVHALAASDFWLQLGVYAYILSQVEPHQDYCQYYVPNVENIEKIRLFEFQLLQNILREYKMSKDDFTEIEDYIYESVNIMKMLSNGMKYKELDINQFQTTHFPDLCNNCKFKKVCWEENIDEKY